MRVRIALAALVVLSALSACGSPPSSTSTKPRPRPRARRSSEIRDRREAT